jgi:hypothetical protein
MARRLLSVELAFTSSSRFWYRDAIDATRPPRAVDAVPADAEGEDAVVDAADDGDVAVDVEEEVEEDGVCMATGDATAELAGVEGFAAELEVEELDDDDAEVEVEAAGLEDVNGFDNVVGVVEDTVILLVDVRMELLREMPPDAGEEGVRVVGVGVPELCKLSLDDEGLNLVTGVEFPELDGDDEELEDAAADF